MNILCLPTLGLTNLSKSIATLSQLRWNIGVGLVSFMLHIHAWPDIAEIVFISEHSKTAVYTVTNIRSYPIRKHTLVQTDFVKGLSKRFICFKMHSFPEALLIKCYSFTLCKSIENQLGYSSKHCRYLVQWARDASINMNARNDNKLTVKTTRPISRCWLAVSLQCFSLHCAHSTETYVSIVWWIFADISLELKK